jgi:hypothetical protein
MTENENIDNRLKEIFGNLDAEFHVSPEMMLADIDGKLSPEGHSKIQSHIKLCEECRMAYEIIETGVNGEQEYGDKIDTINKPLRMPEKVSAKLELLAVLNENKDHISEEIAKLFLPHDQWFIIRPIIRFINNNKDKTVFEEDTRELAAAAFTSYDEGKKRLELKNIEQCINFQNLVYENLLENATDIHNCKTVIENSIKASIHELETVDITDDKKELILNIFITTLNINK